MLLIPIVAEEGDVLCMAYYIAQVTTTNESGREFHLIFIIFLL